ncbi:MAG: hypothetical protein DRI39_07055 [Chloroflexi bacterium]|nr:MAG: hypothetical protein DRI39_07055 [Chloroflexota bacterium]
MLPQVVTLLPIGDVDMGLVQAVAAALEGAFPVSVRTGNASPLPRRGWDNARRQYLASRVLAELTVPRDTRDRALGVVDVDLYAPGLNFVFGLAEPNGRRALISLARLRQGFYGLPEDEDLLRERALKEAVHELGHTYGLGHCPKPTCVMHFSNSLGDTDVKHWTFCSRCQTAIAPHK